MNDSLSLLLGQTDATLLERIQELSPNLQIFTSQDLEQQPDLASRVEIVYGGLKPDQLSQAKSLRWLQLSSAGVNRWVTDDFRERKVLITTASGIHAQPITEHMFGMLLAVTRCLNEAFERQQRHEWGGFPYGSHVSLLAGKTLGILGVGAIGAHSAKVGAAFEMKVIGLRRSGEPMPHVERMYTPEQRLEFFSQSDVVMNILPITKNTRGFMGEAEFAALPDGAIVINTGRGSTIQTEALMNALRSGRLRAALLDVTDPEPLPSDHPLWDMPNVFVTPHVSGGHPGYMQRANEIFLDNLGRYLRGEELRNVVDMEEGY